MTGSSQDQYQVRLKISSLYNRLISPVFFFDRSPQQFNVVLDVYRKKEIHISETQCTLGRW